MIRTDARKPIVVAVALCAVLGFSRGSCFADGEIRLAGMEIGSTAAGPVLHLAMDGEVEAVHYSPKPGVWIVEMPAEIWDGSLEAVADQAAGIDRAQLDHVEEFGRTFTQLTVWLADPSRLDLEWVDDGLELQFSSAASGAVVVKEPVRTADGTASQQVDEVPSPSEADSDRPARPVTEEPVQEVVASAAEEPAADVEAPSAETVTISETDEGTRVASIESEPLVAAPGTDLLSVHAVAVDGGVLVELVGDGPLEGRTFTLPEPRRLVVDLPGVVNRSPERQLDVGSASVRRVRVAQFKAVPDPVTRLVLDLDDSTDYRLEPTASGARLTVGSVSLPSAADDTVTTVAEAQTPKSTPVVEDEDRVSDAVAAWQAQEAIEDTHEASADPVSIDPEPTPAQPVAAATDATADTRLPPVRVASDEVEDEPIVIDGDLVADPWVADPSQLLEKAPAAQSLGVPTEGGGGAADPAANDDNFKPREVDTEEQRFTGEPITLTLKDADVKDVLRTFATLTGLNIVVDPGVSGSVTVELRDVPWDQALDLVLRINGLSYILENNVLRVATAQVLRQEQQEQAELAKEQEIAGALKTVLRRVSYAPASEIATTVQSEDFLLSPRGSIVVDQRTQTLIIRDLVDRVESILEIIDTLDQPEPQVSIEARIVETTRNFSQQIGFNWGFFTTVDAEHGNDTGLEFPNSIVGGGTVGMGGSGSGDNFNQVDGGGVVGFTFGDILDTFNLDFVLNAAENEGIAKVVSSPRVVAQNNESAQIQSGTQIPIQTVANNTVTVQYVNATLQLQVTPQITAEGTVLLDVNIQKRAPLEGIAVVGGNNAPISTRDVNTKILVRDGGTAVIGGIYELSDDNSKNRVPGLGKIPIVKWLFQNKSISRSHDELLIFITPRIMKF